MWYCPNCRTQNAENSRFCVECGQQRGTAPVADASSAPVAPVNAGGWTPAPVPPAPPKKKKSLWWVWLLVVLALLAAAAVTCFFTVHLWTPATCTEPETCKICHKTRAPALGHSFSPATCTEPEVCSVCGAIGKPALGHDADPATCTDASICRRCGEELSPALGHDWQPATYDEPETCSRCGQTRGELKGWVGDLTGTVANQNLYLYSNNESHPYVLNDPVDNCLRLTVNIRLNTVTGNPYGNWALFGRDSAGNWQKLATFYVSQSDFGKWATFDLELGGDKSFDALSMVPLSDNDYNISYNFYYENVQEYIG